MTNDEMPQTVAKVIARYEEIVRSNNSPEWDTIVAVAECEDGCGCGRAAVVGSQVICDAFGFAQPDRQTGEWWLAECRGEAEADLRCG